MPSTAQLKRALEIAEQMESLEHELQSLLRGEGTEATPESEPAAVETKESAVKTTSARETGRKKRFVSSESRQKMAEAQRRRWAKTHGVSLDGAALDGAATAPKPAKKRGGKRVLTAESRAKMAEAQRRRWSRQKGE